MYILDNQTNTLVEAEIVKGTLQDMPLKKNGWGFNWRAEIKKADTEVFILRLLSDDSVQGALSLRMEGDMLVMDLVEIAPHNKGQTNKRYKYVAECLIAYACQQTLKLEENYYGYLVFTPKTDLIDLYTNKYYAEKAGGQRMYIAPIGGKKLIEKYLNRKKDEE